jgi:TIR domain
MPDLYIIADTIDLRLARKLKDAAARNRADAVVMDQNEAQRRDEFEQALKWASVVIFLHGQAQRQFIEAWLNEFVRKTHRLRIHPIAVLYQAPPEKAEKDQPCIPSGEVRIEGSQKEFTVEGIERICATLSMDERADPLKPAAARGDATTPNTVGPAVVRMPTENIPEAGPTGQTEDDVEASVFAPARVAPGTQFTVQAYLHVLTDAAKVFGEASKFDKGANLLAAQTLTKRIMRSASVELFLASTLLLINAPFRTITWNGAPRRVAFDVEGLGQRTGDTIEAALYISVGGIPVGDIEFKVRVGHPRDRTEGAAEPQAIRYEKAFISYARPDFDKVSLFAQGLAQNNIKPCVDVTDLEPGQEWEQELHQHIADSNVFYLMWSGNAARSKWVGIESREAVNLYDSRDPKRPRIIPVTLHRPVPRPPAYLRRFHFDSPWLAQRSAQQIPLFRDESELEGP